MRQGATRHERAHNYVRAGHAAAAGIADTLCLDGHQCARVSAMTGNACPMPPLRSSRPHCTQRSLSPGIRRRKEGSYGRPLRPPFGTLLVRLNLLTVDGCISIRPSAGRTTPMKRRDVLKSALRPRPRWRRRVSCTPRARRPSISRRTPISPRSTRYGRRPISRATSRLPSTTRCTATMPNSTCSRRWSRAMCWTTTAGSGTSRCATVSLSTTARRCWRVTASPLSSASPSATRLARR